MIPVIPTSFTVTKGGETHTVNVGDERGSGEAISGAIAGASCTQRPKAYLVRVESPTVSYNLRLIDTPGIGDTRGIEQDKKNVRAILQHINNMEELHGILFLMKPNDSRLTVALNYCIKELLRHLHRSAADVLLFVFPNARSTFYEPGDSLPPLRTLLRDIWELNRVTIKTDMSTMFCVDSESFRYLAAFSNNISLNVANDEDFRISWEKSSIACRSIVHQIKTLRPHRIKETTTLNEVRNTIILLAKPLSLISTNIERNLQDIETHKKIIQSYRGSISCLKGSLFVSVQELESKALDYPRTVCAHEECTRIEHLSNGSYEKIALRACHKHCYLDSVAVKCIGDHRLTNCNAMVKGRGLESAVCSCGHSYKFHQHEKVEYVSVTRKREDAATKREINQKTDNIHTKEDLIAELEKEQCAWTTEQQTVIKTMAKFAHFLSHNGILSYNSSMEEYIMYQIQEQEDIKVKLSPGDSNQAVIDGLKARLEDYIAENAVLEEALRSRNDLQNEDGGIVSLTDAKIAVNDLKKLPLCGDSIRQAIEEENKAIDRQIRFEQVSVRPPPYRASGSGAGRRRGARVFRGFSNFEKVLGWYG